MSTHSFTSLQQLSLENRPNVGMKDLENYENGGFLVESTHSNGALVYIPYGLWVDLFHAIEAGEFALQTQSSDLIATIHALETSEDMQQQPDIANAVIRNLQTTLAKKEQQTALLSYFSALIADV